MAIYDISVPISNALVVWPGSPTVRIRNTSHVDNGDMATVSELIMSSHTGTHLDAPKHFIAGGATVDTLDLDVLVGWARVVQVDDSVNDITAEVLENLKIPVDTMRLLIKTRNSNLWAQGHTTFDEQYVGVSEDGARWLVERGVRLIGVDYLSVSPFADPVPTHIVLLEAGVIPVEGLNLTDVPPGMYQLVCLPMKLQDGDGAPCRAILISNIDAGAKSGE